jgi:hypothetical protein
MIDSSVSSLKQTLEQIYTYIKESEPYQILKKQQECVLFLSIGYKNQRADVINVQHKNFEFAWKVLYKRVKKYFGESCVFTSIKVDWVMNQQTHSIESFIELMTKTKKNYFRRGISFDSAFTQAFLEQEINGNSMIKIDSQTKRGYLDETNIQYYIRQHRKDLKEINFNKITDVITFNTQGFFCDGNGCFILKTDEDDHGRRNTELDKVEVKSMIQSSQQQLLNLCKENGQFIYGYFSCFDKEINFYNMLRHASSLYALLESNEICPNRVLKEKVERGLNYLLEEKTYWDMENQRAYVIDGDHEESLEIKLGANAAAILALTKYLEIFEPENKSYIGAAQQLANGIVNLQQINGSFIHVLKYPSPDIKEVFRIVYYDGEAAFALMRLYKIDKDPKWLETVMKAFDYFIKNDYWKNHDHWLSYCTNELITFKPERQYFEFGLKNTKDKLDYIYHRNTTYPTFLELMMATYHMIQKLKKSEHTSLLDSFDEKKLIATIHRRAEYQRNGYFYPELAMYFKNPNIIKGGFFIRHHSFRMRIDDIEHYLSGYCQYFKSFDSIRSND